ncbi:hypothetical protein EU527_01745 [Candidatus Thorarchaeota archaeon]|nr:MAG: hypothetical protein EU527_01745 [Candidatus Thorarchaeota archaeon]
MSFREAERKRIVRIRDDIFRDPGGGRFIRREREFVLKNPRLNLWGGIREDALNYFERNQIIWWKGEENQSSGHLLSSQIACLNHLYFVRQRKDIATAILKNVQSDVQEAMVVDDGFVEFEVIGKQNYLGEKSHTRGANATSIDAVMVGKKSDGKNILIMIEWKYTENYSSENKYIPARSEIYDSLLEGSDCPIKVQKFESLYYEPYYQLMRQTLLGWKMIQNYEYGCDEYVHLHVIPSDNKELLERVTSPGLKGETMSKAWQSVLHEPTRYQPVTPEQLLLPIKECKDTSSIFTYLNKRYWDRI